MDDHSTNESGKVLTNEGFPAPLPWPLRLPPEWPWVMAMILCLGVEVMLSVRGAV